MALKKTEATKELEQRILDTLQVQNDRLEMVGTILGIHEIYTQNQTIIKNQLAIMRFLLEEK